jgi:hypothetical protein
LTLHMLQAKAPRMEGMPKYRLFSINYCQFVTLSLL